MMKVMAILKLNTSKNKIHNIPIWWLPLFSINRFHQEWHSHWLRKLLSAWNSIMKLLEIRKILHRCMNNTQQLLLKITQTSQTSIPSPLIILMIHSLNPSIQDRKIQAPFIQLMPIFQLISTKECRWIKFKKLHNS